MSDETRFRSWQIDSGVILKRKDGPDGKDQCRDGSLTAKRALFHRVCPLPKWFAGVTSSACSLTRSIRAPCHDAAGGWRGHDPRVFGEDPPDDGASSRLK